MKGIRSLLERFGIVRPPDHDFLRDAVGVIHVGANTGQERELYARFGLHVLWVEPVEEVFEKLKRNLARFPDQRCVKCLVTDKDDAEYAFHIANNAGASSSILELDLHRDIWPEVEYSRTEPMRSKTLTTLMADEDIDPSAYDVLVMDTQGSELLVLQGAIPLLQNLRYIKTEVADFEAYKDCCQIADLESFMLEHGYREHRRNAFAQHPTGGRYYDIVYTSLP